MPILGALFRSSSYQKRETNLVVIITPHIVRPARPGEPLHSPLDKDMPSNDAEFFLIGAMEVTDDTLRGYANGAGVTGAYGHIIDLDKGGPMSSPRTRLLRSSSAVGARRRGRRLLQLSRSQRHGLARPRATRSTPTSAIQTIDPWPLASSKTDILSDGHARAPATARGYRQRRAPPPRRRPIRRYAGRRAKRVERMTLGGESEAMANLNAVRGTCSAWWSPCRRSPPAAPSRTAA